jgi:DNA-3-methyladenine glycosylase
VGERRLTPLPREFYDRPVLDVAPDLLGRVVRAGGVEVRLTEVEAYDGAADPASHAFRGESPRNQVMFGPAGHAYVYFTYGMHFCVNVVCGPPGRAAAVLLRAGEVVDGSDLAAGRRPRATVRDLARGPARLTLTLGIDRTHNGVDVTDPTSSVVVLGGGARPAPDAVATGPRVGVAAAADRAWRFWLAGDPTVSAYRPHVPRRRPAG